MTDDFGEENENPFNIFYMNDPFVVETNFVTNFNSLKFDKMEEDVHQALTKTALISTDEISKPHENNEICWENKLQEKCQKNELIIEQETKGKEKEVETCKINTEFKASNKSARVFLPDGMRKKLKVNFHSYITNYLNDFYNKKISEKKFNKINQLYISKIDIAFNSALIEKTFYQVYMEGNDLQNMAMINELLALNDIEIKNFLFKKYKVHFNEYLLTDIFNEHTIKVLKKKGELYFCKYKEVATNYIDYFINTRANVRKSKENKKSNKKRSPKHSKKPRSMFMDDFAFQ